MGRGSQVVNWKHFCESTSDILPKEMSEERDLNLQDTSVLLSYSKEIVIFIPTFVLLISPLIEEGSQIFISFKPTKHGSALSVPFFITSHK